MQTYLIVYGAIVTLVFSGVLGMLFWAAIEDGKDDRRERQESQRVETVAGLALDVS